MERFRCFCRYRRTRSTGYVSCSIYDQPLFSRTDRSYEFLSAKRTSRFRYLRLSDWFSVHPQFSTEEETVTGLSSANVIICRDGCRREQRAFEFPVCPVSTIDLHFRRISADLACPLPACIGEGRVLTYRADTVSKVTVGNSRFSGLVRDMRSGGVPLLTVLRIQNGVLRRKTDAEGIRPKRSGGIEIDAVDFDGAH